MLVPWNVRKRSVTIHRKGFFEMKTKRMLASLFAAVSIVTCTAVTASAEAPQGLKNGMTNGFVSSYSQGLKNGQLNGLTNSLINGCTHGLKSVQLSGLKNSLADGLKEGLTNGLSSGLKEGLKKGLLNGNKQ